MMMIIIIPIYYLPDPVLRVTLITNKTDTVIMFSLITKGYLFFIIYFFPLQVSI